MANIFVQVTYEFEVGLILDISGGDPSQAAPSDIIYFYMAAGTSGVSVSSFSSSVFTNTSTLVLTQSSQGKAIRSDITVPTSDTVTISRSGTSPVFLNVNVTIPDTAPNPFNYPNITNLDPRSNWDAQLQVTGFNRDLNVTVTATGGNTAQAVVLRGISVINPPIARDGDIVRVSGLAPDQYNQSFTVTVTIGSTSDNFTVSTRAEPQIQALIRLPIFSPAELLVKRDIYPFFGGVDSGDILIDHYVRGGDYVPDLSVNSGIPTSEPINISQLYGAYTAYYFSKVPISKEDTASTLTSPGTAVVAWDKRPSTSSNLHDWELGFGDNLELTAQYRYVVTRDDGYPLNDITINNNTGNHETFSTGNTYINISATVQQGLERIYYGTMTVFARNDVAGEQRTISRTVNWSLIFFGP